jgi:hypothetical protein
MQGNEKELQWINIQSQENLLQITEHFAYYLKKVA